MLKWNAAKVKNLTGVEIWLFIIARLLIGFGIGVVAAQYFPSVASALKIPALVIGAILFLMASRGFFPPTKETSA